MRKIFVTGIGTDVGKTVVSAVLVEKLKADYWKPIQAGHLNNSDSRIMQELITNEKTHFHSEAYCFSNPVAPILAAEMDGMKINMSKIKMPETRNNIIIEGAGGLMVPLTPKSMIVDLIAALDAEVVLVSKNYLGSINHTLLSIELLKQRKLTITGIIFNGLPNEESEKYILNYSGIRCLGRIKHAPKLTQDFIIKSGAGITI
ncbi:MAG: dethiobiotin synthase [Bacteroidota bacterium]